ncbi:integrase [Phyllobacterium sp. 628]|uniref:integrase n=1 Tax=Phyllobacterium sp. 628 TaxID=2718938 RepID=UPI0016624880|nr:integrase [Phyllobacterium sp. 628]QND51541.1 integrase [Phyllobacterium sp. 628]
MERPKALGLKWMKRAHGHTPIWVANEEDVKRGYSPKTVNLSFLVDNPDMLVAKCNALQADMLLWRTGYRHDPLAFDGTLRSLFSVYQRDEESAFHKLKPGSLIPYKHYLSKLEEHIGPRRVDSIMGIDVIRWHKIWSAGDKKLAAAATCRAVLEAAVRHGILRRFAGCIELREILQTARAGLPQPRRREAVLTAEQAIAARQAAHAAGRPSSALLYAFVYETTLRLWDVAGQWWPIDKGGVSEVVDTESKLKWFGLRWENIDDNLQLKFTPSKTANTSGKSVAYPLSKAPMVMEELAHWPEEKRIGPIIVSETTGLPYASRAITERWAEDRKAANIDSKVWARDLRASGITEGRASGATTDDAAKVAGHSGTRTTSSVYDRATEEAAERFADARLKGRRT